MVDINPNHSARYRPDIAEEGHENRDGFGTAGTYIAGGAVGIYAADKAVNAVSGALHIPGDVIIPAAVGATAALGKMLYDDTCETAYHVSHRRAEDECGCHGYGIGEKIPGFGITGIALAYQIWQGSDVLTNPSINNLEEALILPAVVGIERSLRWGYGLVRRDR